MSSRCFVIAEAASAHDGSLDQALRMIGIAKGAGADAVKFQTFHADVLAQQRRAPEYLPIYRKYAMPISWLPALANAGELLGIEFMTTVFHTAYLPVVAPFVKRWKVASFEAGDGEFLDAILAYRQPVIVSNARDGRISARFDARCNVLHCVAAYPAPVDEMNLAVIREPWCAGLSDHSRHVMTGALAVAAGAKIVEVHFRAADTDPANPDYAVSLSPDELTQYIGNIRLAEAAMGSGVKAMQPSEQPWARYAVRS